MLQDWHIVILRASHQSGSLIESISKHKGTPISLPLLEIEPIEPLSQLTTWKNAIKHADFLLVTSANAVHCAPMALMSAIRPSTQKITMGKATTQALEESGVLDIGYTAAPGSTSESVLDESFFQETNVKDKQVVILAGEGGRTVLADTLSERGARVTWIKVYRQKRPDLDLGSTLKQWQQQARYCFVATSSRILENLLALTPIEDKPWVLACPIIVVSERISVQAKEWGFKTCFVAKGPHPEEILVALQAMIKA